MFPGLAILFGLAVFITLLLVALLLIVRAVKDRSWRPAIGAVVLLGALAAYAAWSHASGVDEWNPAPNPQALIGTWRARNAELLLDADGTFRVDARGSVAQRIGLVRADGEWDVNDAALTLRPVGTGKVHTLRVVVANHAYRIIDDPEDIDGWMPWTGLNRAPASPAPE